MTTKIATTKMVLAAIALWVGEKEMELELVINGLIKLVC